MLVSAGVLALGLGHMQPAQATVFGLSDQQADNFADPRFRALPIDRVRLVVPWNAAIADPTLTSRSLAAAFSRGLTPLVAFQAADTDRCPDAPCVLPSVAEYRDAFAAFRARWPQVHEFTAWNEPNHPNQPTYTKPVQAAAYYDALRRDCPACLVVAGDTLDSASMKSWIRDYRAALHTRPLAWSLHNYGDTTYDRPSYTEWLIRTVPEPIWITETGGIVHFSAHGQEVMPYDEARGAASMRKALDIIAAFPNRIARAYIYEWRAGPSATFDSGLVRPDGTARPALAVLQQALGERPQPASGGDGQAPVLPEAQAGVPPDVTSSPASEPPTETDLPVDPAGAVEPLAATSGPTQALEPLAAGTPRPLRTKRGMRVRIDCRRDRPCRGRVTLTTSALLDGSRRALGSAVFRIRAWASRAVLIRMGPHALHQARTAGASNLVATIVLRRPVTLTERVWPLQPQAVPAAR